VSVSDSVAKLEFAQPRIILAVVAGTIMVSLCFYMVVDSLLWFTDRYEAGHTGHKWFAELSYQTNGWLGAILFGLCGAFFIRPWIAAFRRLGARTHALEATPDSLLVHQSFGLVRNAFSLDDISSFELTTEGEALSSGQRALTGVTLLGSQWIVNRSMKKVCLRIFVNTGEGKPKKVHVAAQFVSGGAGALKDFYNALVALRSDIPKF
jgi:hypothetical protein